MPSSMNGAGLSGTEQRFQLMVNSIEDHAIYMLDCTGTVLTWGRGAELNKGYTSKEILGKNFDIFFAAEDVAAGMPALELAKASKTGHCGGEGWRLRKGGERCWESFVVHAMRDSAGVLVGFAKVTSDLTARKRQDDSLHAMDVALRKERDSLHAAADSNLYLAHHDTLTGLPNRSLLSDRIGQGIERAKRYECKVGVLLVDLDGFKRINDTLGHAAGDTVLVTVAGRLKAAVREMDSVVRIGGDEFIVVLPDLTELKDLQNKAYKILGELQLPMPSHGGAVQVTCSIGIAVYPDSGLTVEDLLSQADSAMYMAKRSGKNRLKVFGAQAALPRSGKRAIHLA